MFSHRGAWVNSIGEITEYGLDQRSVYLWTLPMFHCNGWCFTWGRDRDPAGATSASGSASRAKWSG